MNNEVVYEVQSNDFALNFEVVYKVQSNDFAHIWYITVHRSKQEIIVK